MVENEIFRNQTVENWYQNYKIVLQIVKFNTRTDIIQLIGTFIINPRPPLIIDDHRESLKILQYFNDGAFC